MKLIKIVSGLALTAFLLFFVSGVQAYTTDDYYRAGLKLYQAQDYDKAIQYFSAAIKFDPQNVAAYQGRGNCYYVKADYADALQDYKQVQQLSPSPQVNQFVDRIQAKLGGTSPAPNAVGGTASDEYRQIFSKGKIDFKNKQYFSAAKNFEKALEKNHSDFDLFYYLGLTYRYLNDLKNATVALGIANQIKPSSELSSYVKSLRQRLAQDDRDWVDQQLSAAASGRKIHLSTRPANATDFALRLETGLVFPNLTDFAAEGNNGVTYTLGQSAASSYNASIPNLSAELGFEPAVNLDTDVELGFLIAGIPVGTFSEQFNQGTAITTNSYAITGYLLGLNLRWLMGDGPVKFFLAAGPLLTPISINYSHMDNEKLVNGSFMSWGFGGQAQVGVDFHAGDNIAFGAFVSLQAISANNFSGTYLDNSSNVDTIGKLYTLPNGNWPTILPIPNGQTPPSGASATNVDLSGIVPGIHLSMFF